MTGPPSSSYPGQVPPPAAVVSPENEEKSSGFDRKFAGFVLRRPAAIFGDEDESTSVIPPPRLFKALVLEADTLIPKIAPQAVKSAEIVEGDGGVGTIKKISFGEGSHYSYVKHRIDGLDKDNFVYSYSLVEGDALSDKVEKISYEIKLVASAEGGSIIKSTSNYHTTGDVEIKEEDVKAGKEKATGLFKLIENYLVANPDAYN